MRKRRVSILSMFVAIAMFISVVPTGLVNAEENYNENENTEQPVDDMDEGGSGADETISEEKNEEEILPDENKEAQATGNAETSFTAQSNKNGQLTSEIEEMDDDSEKDEYYEEKNDLANSWRFVDGQVVQSKARAAEYTTWPEVEGAVAYGIDVSKHQGSINWEKVKAAGVDYAIIRCGYGMDIASQDDEYWEINADACERLSIPYGTYLYSYATTVERARSEADHVLRLIEGRDLSYPVYYDLEDASLQGLSAELKGDIAEAFCDKIEAAGYEVAIYANTYWFTSLLTDSRFDQWDKWVAQYNTTCTYAGEYTMWQCSSKGRVDGISGNVDLNVDFGAGGPRLVERNGNTYCYNGNTQLFGEQKINGKWYYFSTGTGIMYRGFLDLGNKTVYYGSDGVMVFGEQKIDGKWYYFMPGNGTMQVNTFFDLGSKTVYYGSDGVMVSGEQKIDGKWYYFMPGNGTMQVNTFFDLGSKTVYYGSDGVMVFGEQKIDGKWYYFMPGNGTMQKETFVSLPSLNKIVYYDSSGVIVYGWKEIDGDLYYFDPGNAAMATGEMKINGKWYYFDLETGAMKKNSFVNLGYKTVYYGADGTMVFGEQEINGEWYYFMPGNGALQ